MTLLFKKMWSGQRLLVAKLCERFHLPENKKILHCNVLGQPEQGERRQQQARQDRQGRGTRQRWEHRGEAEMRIIVKKKVDYFLKNGNLNDDKFFYCC